MRILHIAPYNTAGVPIALVNAERRLGHDSRLVTLHRDSRGYQEDICLELPLWGAGSSEIAGRLLRTGVSSDNDKCREDRYGIPRIWKPANRIYGLLTAFRDMLTKPLVEGAIKKHGLDSFDVYQLDGGHGFLKHDAWLAGWHAAGKRVICCYLGSDLRLRGVMPGIDEIADLNITLEWDHLQLHPNIRHVYFPFDFSRSAKRAGSPGNKLRIGHSPTNRALKGSDRIIEAVNKLSEKYPVELVLIENLPHKRALELKATCDIGIDQLGKLGYGISALEWLAMGIPVASSIAPGMESAGADHPIVAINSENIEEKLIPLITDSELRLALGKKGREWLERTHDAERIVKQIHQMAGLN